jgi:molybdopterin molybdotransferase
LVPADDVKILRPSMRVPSVQETRGQLEKEQSARMSAVTPEEALSRILQQVACMPAEERPIGEALDHVLAEDVHSSINLPPYDNSAMDGYAVRAADLAGPRHVAVVGEARAGHLPQGAVGPGTAIRIMTGAPIPQGADAVVPYEKTRNLGATLDETGPLTAHVPSSVRIEGPVHSGLNVRRAGEDVRAGSLLIRSGQALGPSEIAVLAAIGRATVRVIARPVVGVVATGDELAEPGQVLSPSQVFNSNSYALAAMVVRSGGDQISGEAIRDSLPDLQQRLEQVLERADLVITAGGASGGAYDVVAQLAASDWMIEPLTVGMKPGKPLAIGRVTARTRRPSNSATTLVPFIGLPGNPVAAMVAFELFARPAILKMRGFENVEPLRVTAIAEEDFANDSDRVSFVRVRVSHRGGLCYASAVGLKRSSALSSLLQAAGLAEIPGNRSGIPRGEAVRVRLIDWSGTSHDDLLHASAIQSL